jgi:D-lyxose ketol-isomerase
MVCAWSAAVSLTAQKNASPKDTAARDAKDSTGDKPVADKSEQWVTPPHYHDRREDDQLRRTQGPLIVRFN